MSREQLWQGIEQFNQQQFYRCHDILEALWLEAEESERNFYQGILQIAVGCYHLGNHNWRGAVILLGEGTNRLSNYQPVYHNIDVLSLVEDSIKLLHQLQAIKPEQVSEFVEKLNQTNSEYQLPTIFTVNSH